MPARKRRRGDPAEVAIFTARLEELVRMQADIEARTRLVAIKAMHAGMNIREVADVLGVSHATIINRYGRQGDRDGLEGRTNAAAGSGTAEGSPGFPGAVDLRLGQQPEHHLSRSQ